MDIQLKPELAKFVDEQVKQGHFSSPEQVLEAGLARLMLDPESDELDPGEIAALTASLEQMKQGAVVDWKELSAQLRAQHLGE